MTSNACSVVLNVGRLQTMCRPPSNTHVIDEQDKGRPLPKFGEWDVNNPASADGFTVIFAKARDEKKTNGTAANGAPGRNDPKPQPKPEPQPPQKKWFCCF